jgi:hypothetical protein
MSAYCTRLASTRHDKRAESAGSLGATGGERATGMDAAMQRGTGHKQGVSLLPREGELRVGTKAG